MKVIVTLTLNPAIDASCQAEKIHPIHKIRTTAERYDPGGGGVNVARVIRELGGEALAVYCAGGLTGQAFDQMVDALGLARHHIPIAGLTRVSHNVFERSSGQEYRFVPEGPSFHAAEWRAALTALETLDFEYLVASGSLPQGVPADFYARVAEIVRAKGGRLVLDTSGEPLREALAAGVYLIKPSRGELERLLARPLRDPAALAAAAGSLAADGATEMVAVSLGADGALLATAERCMRLEAPPVEIRSAVGAGDSFVGGMTLGLAEGRTPDDAFALAVATGSATVLTMGTELCRRDDVMRLYEQIRAEQTAGAA